MTVDPALVMRLRGDLLALAGDPLPGPVGVAVSGGPDSMALLALAAAAFPGQVHAATVDHQLRASSAGEAALVGKAAATLGVPHAILSPAEPIAGASLQAQARAARYALLAEWAQAHGLAAVATAHHADDQAETLLMRLARGAGIAGMSGIRPRATIAGATVLRPLLRWRRADLRAIVEGAALPFVEDASNDDPRHDRTHARRLLADAAWLDPDALARTADALREANDDLAALADLFWAERARVTGETVMVDTAGLPRDPCRRLARRAIAAVRAAAGIAAPDFDESANVEPLLDALQRGRNATHAGVVVRPRGPLWRFSPAPPRRSH